MNPPASPPPAGRGWAGVETRLRGLLQALGPLPLGALAAGWLLRALWPRPELTPPQAGGGLLLLAVALAALLAHNRRRAGRFFKGALGEEAVAAELARGGDAWDVFHAPAGIDCDHLALDDRAVFAIETKSWNGGIRLDQDELLLDGRKPRRAPLAQVTRAAEELRARLRAETHLDVPVVPVLCFARGDLPAARQEWNGVRVCRLDALRAALAPDPAYAPLPPEARRRIGDCLARLVGGAWCD